MLWDGVCIEHGAYVQCVKAGKARGYASVSRGCARPRVNSNSHLLLNCCLSPRC